MGFRDKWVVNEENNEIKCRKWFIEGACLHTYIEEGNVDWLEHDDAYINRKRYANLCLYTMLTGRQNEKE